ncbi:MAG: sigma-70 family RNA polymerase sigma factor [Actinomycetes bacterium]
MPFPAESQFEQFYRSTRDGCLRAVVVATGGGGDAEELVAEAYARAWARWAELNTHPSPAAWIVRTAVNLQRDRHRRDQRGLRLLPRIAESGAAPAVQLAVDPAVLDALRRLPQRQREVVAYRVLLGLPTNRCAEILGIGEGSVATHLHRALAALRRSGVMTP